MYFPAGGGRYGGAVDQSRGRSDGGFALRNAPGQIIPFRSLSRRLMSTVVWFRATSLGVRDCPPQTVYPAAHNAPEGMPRVTVVGSVFPEIIMRAPGSVPWTSA